MGATTNLVPNPSFETVLTAPGDQWPDQWDYIGTGIGGYASVADPATGGGSWCMDLYKDSSNHDTWHHLQTHSRISVTAGQQYYASTQVKAVTTVGYTAGVFVYWFSSSSGGSALGSVGGLVSVTTSYQVSSLTAAAPAGAQWAEVRLYTNGQPSNTDSRWDLVVFGPAGGLPGNLLPYAAQSMETGVGSWVAKTNTTISQTSAAAFADTFSMQITATAAGDASAEFVPPDISITAGSTYKASFYARASTGTPQAQIELEWYTAAGTYLSSSTALVTINSTGWTQVGISGAAAPGTAAKVRPRLWGKALAAAAWIRVDEVFLASDPVLSGNLLTSNEQTCDTTGDNTLWVSQANVTISRTTTGPITGAGSLLDTAPVAGASRFGLVRKVAVTAGSWYTVGLTYQTPTAAAYQMRIGADVYNASNVFMQTVWGPIGPTAATGTATATAQLLMVPAGTASICPVVEVTATASTQAFKFDQMTLRTATAPPWTATVDGGLGAVSLTFGSPQPPGYYTTITIYRTDPGGGQTPIRYQGGETIGYLIGSGTLWAGTDYEAPRGVPVTYTARWSGTGVADYVTTTDPLTVPDLAGGQIHLKHPGRPGLNATFIVEKGPDWSRKTRQQALAVRGSARPVVVSDVRSSREGTITVFTVTDDDRRGLHGLIDDGGILLVQPPPGYGFDGQMYCAVGDVDETRVVDVGYESMRRWTLALTEVDRPVGGTVGSAVRDWQDVRDDLLTPTWQDVLNRYGTWYDLLTGAKT